MHESTSETARKSVTECDRRAGKYLIFCLANEEYGIEIMKVREIIGLMDITPVPRTPDFVLGVTNLRGKVIPVIDLRRRFIMPQVERTAESCIIVVDVAGSHIGTMVDRVSEVMNISAQEIEDPPRHGGTADNEFILGLGKSKGRVMILLDINRILNPEEKWSLRGSLSDGSRTV